MQRAIRQYTLITANYWAFTLSDGALRMLVLLHFHQLGYSPLAIASLFLFYEIFGVVTNLVGGWLGARIGLNRTMHIGLALQLIALGMLLAPPEWLTVIWVMAAQALSGVAKDLNKMSAKSAIKLLVPEGEPGTLYRWVALLTGSKNTLKGVGFFLGGALLSTLGFDGAVGAMLIALSVVWLLSLWLLRTEFGKAGYKPKFRELLSKSPEINRLSAARLFLFAARDVWFVVALPVYLSHQFGWDFWQVGGFLAVWIIGYGGVQALAPRFTGETSDALPRWAWSLSVIPLAIAAGLFTLPNYAEPILIGGLLLFALAFAINSSLHSFLIVHYAKADGVSLDVGFYYMSNALGRLLGTVLSGAVFQWWGLEACLLVSTLMLGVAAMIMSDKVRT